MPLLPWKKKSRVSRISRIVADLQPPNRGNSLVVQTGFPTSLIDLFVKNKQRLKKKKLHKQQYQQRQQQQQQQNDCLFEEELVRDVEILSGYFCISEKTQEIHDNLEIQKIKSVDNDNTCELMVSGDNDVSNFDQVVYNCDSSGRSVLMLLILKIFVVMVLALITKRVAVGITISVLLLMILEYLSKHLHLSCLLRPYSYMIQSLLSSFGNVINVKLLRYERNCCVDLIKRSMFRTVEKEENFVGVSNLGDVVEVIEFKSCIEEIQVIESDPNLVDSIEDNRKIVVNSNRPSSDKGSGCLDGERIGDLICKKQESRRNKIKCKFIRKLVPKKLRGGKVFKHKEKKGEIEVPPEQATNGKHDLAVDKGKALREQLLEEQDEEVEEDNRKRGGKSNQGYRRCSSGFYTNGEHKSYCGIRRTKSTGFLANKEMFVVEKVVEKRTETERKGNSGYLVFLLVVLVGLLGGRILAFVFTVSSCLIFRSIRRNRRFVEEHTTTSFPSR